MLKLVRSHRFPLLLASLICACLALLFVLTLYLESGIAQTNVYRINRKSQWEEWRFPAGLLDLRADGAIAPVQFKQRHNAALNTVDFTHELVGGKEVTGGVHRDKVGSNLGSRSNIIDGDPDTFWKPDPDDDLENWWIELDLGRATLVTEIRLVFPDQEGARPFQEFRVFGSEGRRVTSRENVYSFYLIGGTTQPINQTEVVYNVEALVNESDRTIADPDARTAVSRADSSYDLLQYIRFIADAPTPDAALAEIEVYTPGENVALGTLARFGTVTENDNRGAPTNMTDGDINTDWGARQERQQLGVSWEWDLGGLFWVDRIIMRASDFKIRTTTYGSAIPLIRTHSLLVSDGSSTLTGAIDYDILFEGSRAAYLGPLSGFPGQVSYRFPSRPIRHIKADWQRGGETQSGWIGEAVVLPTGYVAQVDMVSGFIDLGQIAGDQRPKVIKSINWDADLPPGAFIQARTRTGVELQDSTLYFRKDGTQVTQKQYEGMITALRGPTETYTVAGDDWSEWSNFYKAPGTASLSPSPRRFVQVMLILGSDQPTTAPVLHSFSIEYNNAFLTGITGVIEPRTALPGVDTTFTYLLKPRFATRDPGFDQLLVKTPSLATAEGLSLKIDGLEREPKAVQATADSLIVQLPLTVRRQEVELSFRSTPIRNATPVNAFVGRAQQPQLWQPVDPDERFTTTVFLPTVPGSERLISNLSVSPVITPNGDGVGDLAEIRFAVLKVEESAQVRIYTLNGELVQELQAQPQASQSFLYTWSGDDRSGNRVSPGTYLCQITLKAQIREETLNRTISVVY